MTTFEKIHLKSSLFPPQDWLQIKTIDMHTGGEPLRVILDGFPNIEGNSVLEYRRYIKNNYDHLRKALMWEPRGHADMYGCILTPPNDGDGDFGIIFMHNEGYSTMCGHAIIAISTLAIEMKWIDVKEGENTLKIDAPCGRITSIIEVMNGSIASVKFHGVPSFVIGLDYQIMVPGLGNITYDLSYGGAFYAFVDMDKNDLDFDLSKSSYQNLKSYGMEIKRAVMESNHEIVHPYEEDLGFLYGTIFLKTDLNTMTSTNVCIFAEGEVDRSPTGSGVMGRIAIHRSRNEIDYGQKIEIASILGSKFFGSMINELEYGTFTAVIPCVEGTAHLTGIHTFIIDPDDPLKGGFIFK